MTKSLLLATALLFLPLSAAFAQYGAWRNTGTLAILTTPEGANLPATAREEGFPILVRLSKETFDFGQAKAGGVDIRFSAGGNPLAYQVEQWDVAQGTASIWVRVPAIRGNARQTITMSWGKDDAKSESNGAAVFNESNGYPLTGWAEFARPLQPMIERDIYGKVPTGSISPPNLCKARYTTAARDEIALEFVQPVAWYESLAGQFYLDDEAGEVTSGTVSGNTMTLKLKGESAAKKITYLKERDWNQEKLIPGANGIAALTFCEVPIAASVP